MTELNEHIVASYDEELRRLRGEILNMGRLAIGQLEQGMHALKENDSALADHVIASDARIDALELEVSSDVIRLLARRQPMAIDLRVVLSSLRIAANIERIGDYGANIAKRSLALAGTGPRQPIHGLAEMAEYAANMLRAALDALVDSDAGRAMAVRESDIELDKRYNSLFRELLTYTMEDARNISACAHYMFIAKNIERIGDHVTNIAENIWFETEGQLLADDRAKGDTTNITPSP